MKELLEYIWNMPMGSLLLIGAIILIPILCWFIYIFRESRKSLAEMKARREKMHKRFDRMEKRVTRTIGD